MHARLRGLNNISFLHQNINKPDFPSLGDEIAEPRPDMNIKVAAFTVTEKAIYTGLLNHKFHTSSISHCKELVPNPHST